MDRVSALVEVLAFVLGLALGLPALAIGLAVAAILGPRSER